MEKSGFDKNVTLWILSYVAFGNVFGRLTSGLTSFFPKIDIIFLAAFSTAICGIINILSSFILTDNVAFQITCAVVFGFHLGIKAITVTTITLLHIHTKDLNIYKYRFFNATNTL